MTNKQREVISKFGQKREKILRDLNAEDARTTVMPSTMYGFLEQFRVLFFLGGSMNFEFNWNAEGDVMQNQLGFTETVPRNDIYTSFIYMHPTHEYNHQSHG
jgi:hypothetical protein